MAVLIGNIDPRSTVFNDDQLQLEGAFGIHVITQGERTFVYVAGRLDGGLSGFELDSDGGLTNIFNLDDGPPAGALELKGVTHFASASVGGIRYLYSTGSLDDGLSAFRVEADGRLTNIQNVPDNDTLELNGTSGKMIVATVGGASFLVASGDDDNGVSVFRIGPQGRLTNTDNVVDNATLFLDDAHDIVATEVGGKTFLSVAGGDDDGLSVFELRDDGTLHSTFDFQDDADTNLDNPWGLASATVGGTAFVIASGRFDHGLSVFSVSDTGTLTNVFNVDDNATRGLAGVVGVTAFDLDGESFVMASGADESALAVFHLGPDGVLTDVTTIFDTAALALGYTVDNAFAVVDGKPMLLASGYTDNGLTSFAIGEGNDDLVGTRTEDLLLGLGGNDRLDGAQGDDRMIGGSGNDDYFVDSLGDDVIEQRDAGGDRVRSSISYVLGENLESLDLLGNGDLDGTGNGFANVMSGTSGRNRLAGLAGNDEIRGGGGADILRGGGGDDDLVGGRGSDLLKGGQGHDDFIFRRITDSGTSEDNQDIVKGFGGKDRIVLQRIDANTTASGDQDFELGQGGSFDAGQIRATDIKAGVVLEFNTDNDARAEMSILLKGFDGNLTNGDFVF